MPPDLDALLAEVRELTNRYKAGRQDAFDAFRELASRLLHLTVLYPGGGVRLASGPRGPETLALGGWGGPDDPLPLNDGRSLRLSVVLYLEPFQDGHRLKVEESSYQYQMDRGGERWIFRYDYLRHPPSPHPAAHLQVRGELAEHCLPERTPLERIHFPTGRVSLEAIIRLLADQFDVPCNRPAELWRPVLAESEGAFLEIAHRPLSGPEH